MMYVTLLYVLRFRPAKRVFDEQVLLESQHRWEEDERGQWILKRVRGEAILIADIHRVFEDMSFVLTALKT